MNARTSTTTSTGRDRRRSALSTRRTARGTAVAVGVAALTLPFLVAVPAQAATTLSGCTVTPLIPVANGDVDATNTPMVDYVYTVTCDPGRSVQIVSQYWEQDTWEREDDDEDDQFDSAVRTRDFTNASVRKTKTVTVEKVLPSLDGSGDPEAEVYQKVKFKVSSGGVDSPWTAFELTLPQFIHQ